MLTYLFIAGVILVAIGLLDTFGGIKTIPRQKPEFHSCEVCGAPAVDYCTSCGSEQQLASRR